MRSLHRSAGSALAACVTLALASTGIGVAAATESVVDGPPVSVGNGTAHAYVTINADGTPSATGIRLTAAALDGLPDGSHGPSDMYPLALPQAAPATVFDHLTLDWNPHGHEPAGVFTKPHFDMHFYMIDSAAVGEITPMRLDFLPRASNVPAAQRMPTGYAPPAGLPVLNTVPDMGMHWLDTNAGITAPGFDFQQVLIAGSWDGAHTFLEPMMSRDWLLTRARIDQPVAQPQIYPRSGYYPTTYSVRFDDHTGEYVVELGGLTMRQAS